MPSTERLDVQSYKEITLVVKEMSGSTISLDFVTDFNTADLVAALEPLTRENQIDVCILPFHDGVTLAICRTALS